MIVTAHGRALAMDRAGDLVLSTPLGSAFGAAEVALFTDSVCFSTATAVGQASSDVFLNPGDIFFAEAHVKADGGIRGVAHPGSLSLEEPTMYASVPGLGEGHPGTFSIEAEEFTLHSVGASMAGASYTTMVRVSPVRPVVEYDSQGPTDSDVISAVPVLWLDVMVSNSGGSTLYLMFFDSGTVPVDGSLPFRQPLQVSAGSQTFADLGDPGADGLSGRPTANGLSWAASTTATALTTDSTNSLWVTARTITLGT